jgi:diguanylate cyclase (GGDEF)-like protein/PAS domain S-box-containing protein
VFMATIQQLRRALAVWLWPPVADMAPERSDARAGDQRLRAITNDLPAVVTQFDAEGRLVFANRFVQRRLGTNPENMLGVHLRAMTGEALYAKLQVHFERALSGQKVAFEVSFPVDGIERSFSANYVPEFDAKGVQTGVFALLIDITDRIDSETRRAASEQRLRTITDNLPIMIGFVDQALDLLFYNATFLQWMGRTAEEMAGKTLMDIVNAAGEERAALIRPFIARALAGERVEFELAPTPGRTDKWLRMTFVPEVDSHGQVSGLYLLSIDVSQLKQVQLRLSEMAQFDELTGLPNRYQFNDKLREATLRSNRSGKPMGVVYLDIDHFKQVNDSLGHAAGDAVLKEFATRLRGCVRATDTVARLAGDEFVMVLEGVTDGSTLVAVAEKILAAMLQPFEIDGASLAVTSSVGLSLACGPGLGGPELLACADAALYEAKRRGKATYRLRTYVAPGLAPIAI